MSVEAISAVLNYSTSTGTARNVVTTMANRADEHGLCFPSVEYIKTRANCSARAVQYALRKLEEIGELQILAGAGGGRKVTPLYYICLPTLDGEVSDEHNYFLRQKGARVAPPEKRQRAQAVEPKGASGGPKRAHTSAPDTSVDTSLETSNNKQTVDPPDPVAELYDFWKRSTNRNGDTKLTPGRRTAVKARLDEGRTVAEVKRAILNCSRSQFHQGINPQKRRYDDLTLICRNGEKLEDFRDMGSSPGAVTTIRPSTSPITETKRARESWRVAKARLRDGLSASRFRLHIEPLEAAGERDGHILVLVDTTDQGSAGHVARKLKPVIVSRLGEPFDDVEIIDEAQLELEDR